MKLLIEYDKGNGSLLAAIPNGVAFVDELPETSGSCIVEDEELSKQIWESHSNGGAVTITITDDRVTADVTPVEPPAPLPTLEKINAMLALELADTQFRLQAAEQAQADLILNLVLKGVL
ncbi:hypothetical protein [Paenibacillus sp. JDR-2]|uniref:hypothetical protein n=1 Tax=Paenibacillus sp. (strain JDR-2) TaxID=324057 RepID=UPI000166A346|nr:hypothetical protein [Paenibacillus sp. JDR-2]ACT00232.1 hypothetical protein Pjdr2_1560 [Paenibacillus sp. JDR-2]